MATMSKRNQEWFESGRKARFKATLEAARNHTAVLLPESSYNATAHHFWREGWNSISLAEMREYLDTHLGRKSTPVSQDHPLTAIKQRLGSS